MAKRNFAFWDDAGEMGELIKNFDWSTTPIGTPERWPQSLCSTLGILLHSGFPMFLFWGKDLTCFYNNAFRPSLGVSGKHDWALGKKGEDVWAEIWAIIQPWISQVLNKGKAVMLKDQLVPFYRNGRLEDIYWTFSYSPAYGDTGEIEGVLVTCIETTETVLAHKKVEETVIQRTKELEAANASLRNAYDYLQSIINLFKEPLQVLEPVFEDNKIVDFRYKLTNAAYAAYANTTPEQLLNKRVGDVFPGYFETSSFINVVEAYNSGVPATWEIHYDKDGFDLYNEMSATKLDNEIMVHFTDFTKLKHLQLELLKKIEELKQSNIDLEAFAYAASHDLKEPTRKIHIFCERLKDSMGERMTEQEKKYFERIELASNRMSSLIDSLLTYSEFTQRSALLETVDLNQLIEQVLNDLDLEIEQKKAHVFVDPLFVINGHRHQLQQAFQNLIGNALKYSKATEAPVITIKCQKIKGAETDRQLTADEQAKTFYLLMVTDNGIGFEQQDADRIFNVFTRLHGIAEYKGTGVGLSIVRKVIENHHGYIWAESKPGQGTVFNILLPAE